jgi:hypothetical protein
VEGLGEKDHEEGEGEANARPFPRVDDWSLEERRKEDDCMLSAGDSQPLVFVRARTGQSFEDARELADRLLDVLNGHETLPHESDGALEAEVERLRPFESLVRRLREEVAYWELSARPRLLGIAPDQLERTSKLLSAVHHDARRGALDRATALYEAWKAWDEAGRPLLDESEKR